jgi:hypothetical protein
MQITLNDAIKLAIDSYEEEKKHIEYNGFENSVDEPLKSLRTALKLVDDGKIKSLAELYKRKILLPGLATIIADYLEGIIN